MRLTVRHESFFFKKKGIWLANIMEVKKSQKISIPTSFGF